MPAQDEHVIRVTVGKGSIDVDPEVLSADYTDRIRWESTNGARFRIRFEDGVSCFEQMNLAFDDAVTARRPSKSAEMRRYKYSVVDENDDSNVADPYIKIKSPTIEDP